MVIPDLLGKLIFEGVILSVYSNMSSGFYGMLANATATTPIALIVSGNVGLKSWGGDMTTQNITIFLGTITNSETSILYVNPPAQWFGKWLALNVTARFELSAAGVCNIEFNFIWWVGEGF